MSRLQRFHGFIAGAGTTSGVRVVVGYWVTTPFGSFSDVMLEEPSGHRVLLAPTEQVADFIAGTYTFDEVRIVPVSVERTRDGLPASGRNPARERWAVRAGDEPSAGLDVRLDLGGRTSLGWLHALVPDALPSAPAYCVAIDPIARVVVPGVRTAGTARAGRREYYGAVDQHAVVGAAGTWEGTDLGSLAAVDPPVRFGFGSTPKHPAVTRITTTIRDL